MYITLYFIVTRLLDSLRAVRGHFLALYPTALTVDLLEQHLLVAESSVVTVGAAHGTPRPPFFEGCSPSPLAPSYASAAVADVPGAVDVGAAAASAKRRSSKGKGGKGSGSGNGGGGEGSGGGGSSGSGGGSGGFGGGGGGSGGSGSSGSGGSGGGRTGALRGGSGGGQMQQQQRRSETPSPQQLREWFALRGASGELLRTGVAIFNLDYDAILAAIYALFASAEGDCYLCVPPDPSIEGATLGANESDFPGTVPAEALHAFTLDSGASHSFFRDSTTLTPLSATVPVRLADPSRGPVLASSSTVLSCPVVPSGSLSGLHLPSFSTNLVNTPALQDAMVTTTAPGNQRVSICTCTRTSRHLATFTRRPGSSLYTLATELPQVAASAQMSASGPIAAPCSCRLLSHQTLLWHHRLGHPSLPRLRGMHSRFLVSGLPRSLPPLPPLPAPPCLPCIEGRQRTAPHSLFPPTTAPLQTLHIDVKGQVVDVLIPWIRAFCLQLREWFRTDLPVLRLHSDRGGEFSSDLLREFCRGEGILQSPVRCASAQPLALSLLVGDFAYCALDGKFGDASVFRVWGSGAFVRDTSADKLSARAIPCIFLGFSPGAPGWQFYHPTSRRVFPSQDVMFDESVPFFCLFPYRFAPPPPPPLFLALGPPPVEPLPRPAPSGVSQVDPLLRTAPVEVAVGSSAAQGAASGGAASRGAEPGGAEPEGAGSEGAGSWGAELEGAESEGAGSEGAEPGGAEPEGVEPGGAEPESVEPGGTVSEGAEYGGAELRGTASSGGPAGAPPRLSPRPEPLSPQQLREWFAQRTCLRSGAAIAGVSAAGDSGAGGAGVTAGAGGSGGAAAAGPGGARTGGTGAAGTGGVGGAGAGDPTEPGAVRGGGAGAVGAGAGGTGAGIAGAGGARAVDPGAGGAGGTVQPRPYFVPLLQQVLGVPSSLDQSQPLLQPASPLPAPSPYTEQIGSLAERREPASRPASPVRTGRRVPCPRPPPVPGTHAMTLRPSSVPLRVPLPPPPESSLFALLDPESDRARAASPTVSCLLATVVTDPSFETTPASAPVAELVDFVAACRLDYATALVAESESACPPSVGG
ncbi:unnamed protein product [Closterium sp. NIES-54]